MNGSSVESRDPFGRDAGASAPDTCPNNDELAALLERGLSGGSDIEAHVARCSTCRVALANATSVGEIEKSDAPLEATPRQSAPRMPSAGERVGRYIIGELVGAGAMGTVYVAHDPELKRRVAVKLLRESEDANEVTEQGRRLLREAQAMARLTHPNVVTVYEVGHWNERIFIAMALVDGGTLRDWCRTPRTCDEIVDAFALAGRGLAAAHTAGLIHRDFKPDNVLVTAAGNVCVTDFGLARSVDDWAAVPAPSHAGAGSKDLATESTVTRTGELIGTPAYMSPEQLDSKAVDARSDVFSFCVALWEALFGERPFQGATIHELRDAVARGPKEPWRTVDRTLPRATCTGPEATTRTRTAARPLDVPAALRDAVRVGLREAPRDRYPSMGALLDALAAARARSAMLPADGQRRGRFASMAARRRVLALVMAVAILSGLVVAGVFRDRAKARYEVPRAFEQLTFNSPEAPVYGVALSPDGANVAYVESRGVFVQEIADRRDRRLDVSPPIKDLWGAVAWFPDGRQLLVGGHGPDGRADLWRVDVATHAATPMRLDDCIAFGAVSPDGTRVAVIEHRGVWAGSLELVAIGGGERTLLWDTHDEEVYSPPRWSPDGRRVAFIAGQGTKDSMTYHLDVVDVATKARRTIVRDDDLAQETGRVAFQWVGDGRIFVTIAPSIFKRGRSGLYAIDARDPALGGGAEAASMHPVPGFAGAKIVDISSDASGKRMVFVREDVQTDVMAGVLSADKRHLDDVRRLTLSDANERPSDWSPDSRDILIVSDAREGYGISALSTESLDVMPIAGVTGRVTWPTTGPAGRGIVYWQVPSESSGAAFLDLAFIEKGKAARHVYRTPRAVHMVGRGRPPPRRWTVRCARSADVCILAHPAEEGDKDDVLLESVDVDRGATIPLARLPGPWQYGFALSPEGKRIAAANPDHTSIDIFDLDGALLRRLTAKGGSFTAATWTGDGNGVLATSTDDEIAHAIFYLSVDGETALLWSTKEGVVTSPIASPDGRRVAFTMTQSRSNVWLSRD